MNDQRPDRHDSLREALSSLVPEPPEVPDRAGAARQRHRSRRARILTAGAVVAVLAVIAVPLALGGLGASSNDSPSIVADDENGPGSQSLSAAAAVTCASLVEDGTLPPLTGANTLPEGPVAVLMCSPGGGVSFQAPPDALTQDPDALVDLINAAPLRADDPNMACTMDLGPTWEFVFGYADGSTRTIRAERHGCGGIFVGDGVRGDSGTTATLVDAFTGALHDQRAGLEPPTPAPVVETSCRDPYMSESRAVSAMPLRAPVEFDSAVLCLPDDATGTTEEIEIGADELSILLADIEANTSTTPRRDLAGCSDFDSYAIYGVTPWGDRQLLSGHCGEFFLDVDMYWHPSPAASDVLATLAADAR
ncbi:hypothetical protein [Nocardioides sp. AE5]|uniref:hypothetical protein n=1 Tax=Nocardioides sp. AE5 TaxID=2962573 RepID=UPI002881348C|nr:hypothetical protein [Nocardioides sp. AE5]MDT0202011.1 hypothetical protein [Nocardioides sp. AE5]